MSVFLALNKRVVNPEARPGHSFKKIDTASKPLLSQTAPDAKKARRTGDGPINYTL